MEFPWLNFHDEISMMKLPRWNFRDEIFSMKFMRRNILDGIFAMELPWSVCVPDVPLKTYQRTRVRFLVNPVRSLRTRVRFLVSSVRSLRTGVTSKNITYPYPKYASYPQYMAYIEYATYFKYATYSQVRRVLSSTPRTLKYAAYS